jgi:hypothetical protein
MTERTIDLVRRVAKDQLPILYRDDWPAFDSYVYKSLRDLELMSKLSGHTGTISDLMLLDFMGLPDGYRHVVRLSILQLYEDRRLVRRMNTRDWSNLMTTAKYNTIKAARSKLFIPPLDSY